MYKNIALPREVVKSLDKFAIEHFVFVSILQKCM
jgi:hypothetical protein